MVRFSHTTIANSAGSIGLVQDLLLSTAIIVVSRSHLSCSRIHDYRSERCCAEYNYWVGKCEGITQRVLSRFEVQEVHYNLSLTSNLNYSKLFNATPQPALSLILLLFNSTSYRRRCIHFYVMVFACLLIEF